MTGLVPTNQSPKDLIESVLDSLTSPLTRGAYRRELANFTKFCATGGMDMSRATVQAYRAYLIGQGKGSSSIGLALSAIKALVREASERGCLDEGVAGGILRVHGVERRGRRTGTWLSLEQARVLRDSPDDSLIGKRDSVIIGLLLGCGMRREESVNLMISQYQTRDGHALLDSVEGKHHRVRTVPVPAWVDRRIAEWISTAAITGGRLLRSVSQTGVVGERLSAKGLYLVVKRYAEALHTTMAPHDLRRSFAVLAKKGGADLGNLRDTLGHASMVTTELYLGASMLLENPSCDCTGLGENHERN